MNREAKLSDELEKDDGTKEADQPMMDDELESEDETLVDRD